MVSNTIRNIFVSYFYSTGIVTTSFGWGLKKVKGIDKLNAKNSIWKIVLELKI